jgi:hypothetical protein
MKQWNTNNLNIGWAQMISKFWEFVHPKFHILKFSIIACPCSDNDLPPGAPKSVRWRHISKKRSVSCGLIQLNVWNERSDAIGRWIYFLSHPFLHFTNSSFETDCWVKRKLPRLIICFIKMWSNILLTIVLVPSIETFCETVLHFYEGTKYRPVINRQ